MASPTEAAPKLAGAGRSLVSATGLLALATVAGKPITFARDVVVARHFGATAAVDFVILAQLVPLVVVGAMSNGVVLCLPALFRESGSRAQGLWRMGAFSRRVLVVEAIALAIVGAGAGLFFSLSTPHGVPFPPGIAAFVCVQALMDSAIALRAQALQVDGHFGRPAFQYAANGIVTLVVVIACSPWLGIWSWPVGLVIDAGWQLAFLGSPPRLLRNGEGSERLPQRWLWRLALPSVVLFALTLVYAITDRVVALGIATGFLALWTWAQRVGSAVTGAASLPIAGALLARGHATGRREPVYYGMALAVALGLSAVAAITFAFVGGFVTTAVFGSRALSAAQLAQLKSLIGLVLLGGIFAAAFSVASRAFMGRGDFRRPAICFGASAAAYPVTAAALVAVGEPNALPIAYVVASAIAGTTITALGVKRGLISAVRLGRAALE